MAGKRRKDVTLGDERVAKKAHVKHKAAEKVAGNVAENASVKATGFEKAILKGKDAENAVVKKGGVGKAIGKEKGVGKVFGKEKGAKKESAVKNVTESENVPKKFDQSAAHADEEDFPRGGGGALTPAEIREARSHAESEFQEDIKKPRGIRKASQRSRGTEEPLFGSGLIGKLPSSADILRYKSLSVGMKIWGAVAEVNSRDLVVSLPGGLRGFVKIEDSSDVLATILKEGSTKKRSAKKSKRKGNAGASKDLDSNAIDEEDEDLSADESAGISLKEYFSIGQLVSCRVTTLEQQRARGEKQKSSKRIGLSLRLSVLHEGLTIDVIYEGMPLAACVGSVEDHGYLLTFGVPGISGFLQHQNYGEESKLKVGQLIQGEVISIDKKRSAVSLKAGQKIVAGSMMKDHEGLTMELLLPGFSVNARVRAVLRNGLLLSFLTYFTGTVDVFHLDVALLGSKWSERFEENQRLKAKILYIDPISKVVGLTLNADLLHHSLPAFTVGTGDIFDNAIVRRVDPTVGLLLELPSKSTPTAAYAHISNISDEHVEKLEKKYSEGKKVKARVTGFRMMDGLATVSLKETVLKQLLLSQADVNPGMVVHAVITAVESFGAIVQLGEGLRGLCPLQHMSEYQRVAPSPKFKVGARLKFRVLSSDPQTKKISLTHKKTMVSSKLSPITSYEDAVEGLVTHGWITGIADFGCFVSFYNGVTGLAHRTELGVASGTKPETVFQLGHCIKCRVLRSNTSLNRLSLSFVTISTRIEGDKEVGHDIMPGSTVSGTIVHMKEKFIILDVHLSSGVIKGVLAYSQLSDNTGHIEQEKALLTPGHKFDHLLVLETSTQKLFLSAKYSLLKAAATLPSDISQLQANNVYQGFIANITEAGCFVRFLSRLTGLASIPQVADAFVADASKVFTLGQSVRAQVLEVNEELGKFYLSLKQSVCFSTDATLLQGYFIEEEKLVDLAAKSAGTSKVDWSEELTIGSYVEGEIQDVKDYGVILNLFKHRDVVGFLTHYQLGEPVEVGKKVKARVLDVVKTDGIVDLTLRSELLSPQEALAATPKKSVSKKRSYMDTNILEVKAKVSALVELVKDEYLVLSLPEHDSVIAFASTRDYNLHVLDPHKIYQPGQRLVATIQNLADASTGGRLLLLLNSNEDGEGFSRKKGRKNFRCNSGSLVEGEIVSVNPESITVAVGAKYQGSIHISEVWDEPQEGHPFSAYQTGQIVTARVLARVRAPRSEAGTRGFNLELSIRPSEIAEESEEVKKTSVRPSFNKVELGQMVTGYVQDINEERAWLLVGRHMRCRLYVLDSSIVISELADFKLRFTVGQAISCYVIGKDQSRRTLDLSLRAINNEQMDAGGGPSGYSQMAIKPGMILAGKIVRVDSGIGGLSVQIGGNNFGRVHISHLSDIWEDYPSKNFREGQFVRCCVLEVGTSSLGKTQIDLSLKASLGGCGSKELKSSQKPGVGVAAVVETLQDVSVGLETQGYVKSVTKKGCFVTLSKSVDARIVLSDLSDSFVADPHQSFPPGKLVKGRITGVEPLSGRVEMTLKTTVYVASKSLGGMGSVRQFEDFQVGDLVKGQIRRIESFGVFVTIENSVVVGLCHVSEISDSYIKNINQQYNVGQKVQAKILKVDPDNKRVSLGLKESYIQDGKETETADDLNSDAAPSDNEMLDGDLPDGPLETPEGNLEDEVQFTSIGSDGKYMDQADDDIQVFTASKNQEASTAFEDVPPLHVDLDLSESEPDGDEDVEGEVNNLDKEGSQAPMKKTQRARNREKKEKEAEIRAAEEKRLQNQAPETTDEFEQLVRASPNSSFVWIKYMAFMLSVADIDKAREIAERALQIISFREEAEKLNVWVAYLNLENAYGSPKKEAVLKVFQRALQYCDPKKVHMALLGIYERTEQHELLAELLKTMIRKFKTSAKVWLRNIQNLLKGGMDDGARKGLEQSLLSLPRRKHVKVISQVAIMEFKIGSPERARSIFEGVVRNYPKRTDLWSVYLDQEIRLGDHIVVRALFERAVSLELPAKKIKFLFKKYLDFEKSLGDAERAEYVKNKAMEYVEAKLG